MTKHRVAFKAGLAFAFVAAAALAPFGGAVLAGHDDYGHDHHGRDRSWVGTFATSPQFVRSTQTALLFPAQTTIRQIVHTSIGGAAVRVRLSNEFGTGPLMVGAAAVALRGSGSGTVPHTNYPLTFGGKTSIMLAPGAPALSDPVPLRVQPLSDLAVSLYLPDETVGSTLHSVGLQTNYVAPAGADYTAATSLPAGTTVQNYFFLAGVEVLASSRAVAVVTLGDSITDGTRSTPDTNSRWPNFLAERLQAARNLDEVGVLNEGISGNRIFSGDAGVPTLARFDRDVLSKPEVQFMTVLIGINDIGNSARGTGPLVSADDIVAGYRQIIARAHARGIKVYGATLTPIEGSGYDYPQAEDDRQAVNAWIRTSGEFDAVIDFDLATRDPSHPTRFLPAYDSGDHLHPNDLGYKMMARAIPLTLFQRSAAVAH
ncbi:MAG TPA: SGNH/GDSL hydrolase family protein [Steroidobacteraceae bacterium]|nr:SGNH/GDSL hydrolase family protein [Steroidobacteraceae bacterium]